MIYFEIPDSPTNRPINVKLVQAMGEKPELFRENVVVEAAFGCIYNCIWNGGCSHVPGEECSLAGIIDMFDRYESINIPYRITFSNRRIEEKHLADVLGNIIAKKGERDGNAVIVASDILQQYIMREYPTYEIIQSVSRVPGSVEEINDWLKDFRMCLPVWINRKIEDLRMIERPERAILLINEFCPVPNCEFCLDHYETISRIALYEVENHYRCHHHDLHEEMVSKGQLPLHNLLPDELSLYEDLGFKHFKLTGRAAKPAQIIDTYTLYFAKKETADKVREILGQY